VFACFRFACLCCFNLGQLFVAVNLLAVVAFASDPKDLANERPTTAPPVIELSRLEPAVATQLQSVQSILVEVTSKTGATRKQRADAYGEFGRVLHAYGYTREAADCYRHATSNQPEDPRWWHLLGCAHEASGELAEAVTAFRQAKRWGDFSATRVRLGNALTQLNQRAEARRIFDDLLAVNPKLAAAHAGVGTLALEDRDFKTAVEHLSQALKLAPAANRLHYSLALAYRGTGDLERARQHLQLRGVIGLRPDDPLMDELPQLIRGAQVHLLRGKVALAAGAVKDAIREYRQAIEADPDSIVARVNLAVALVKTQAHDEAIEQLTSVLKSDPRHTVAMFNLASLYQARGDHSASAELLRKLLEIDPKDIAARQVLSQSLMGLQQPSEAIKVLRDAIELAPDDESATVQLAELLKTEKQYAAALELLEAAMAKHPDRGLTAHALARQLATCPDTTLRNGVRAFQLSKAVHDVLPTFEHTETLAMALAASDRFEEAVRLQRQLLVVAETQRVDSLIARIKENLMRYEKREPPR
jgi:tetratricopeptide (TPR) repeat protein